MKQRKTAQGYGEAAVNETETRIFDIIVDIVCGECKYVVNAAECGQHSRRCKDLYTIQAKEIYRQVVYPMENALGVRTKSLYGAGEG